MYIKEIILDGFKSYCTRTVVSSIFLRFLEVEFDPHFNAITGFNGSGKSNIFDSICFLMGITSLSHVRVSNLQELIYKYGNAGIEKASVTIVFDNSHQDRICPIGMQDYQEITITRQVMKGGKSKYYLNGANASNEKIKQIFQSVQLNVNNPHFLIMQGKVTQVAKMKPKELLSLLEEAAGTSLYEGKKKAAEVTIEKKDHKLEEIEILSGPIQEKILKNKKEKEMLAKHRNNEEQLGKIRRILVAHRFYEISKTINACKLKVQDLEIRKNEINNELIKATKKSQEIAPELEIQRKKQGPEITAEIEKFKNILHEIQREQNVIIAEFSAKQKELEQEEKDLNANSQEMAELNEAKIRRIKEKEDLKQQIINFENETFQKSQYIKALEDQLSSGNSSSGLKPMQERLLKLDQNSIFLKNDIESREQKCQNLLKEMSELKQKLQNDKNNSANIENQRKNLINDIKIIEKEILQCENNQLDANSMRKVAEQNELKRRYDEFSEQLNNLQGKCRIDINYKLPDENFDKKKVFGRVISLMKLKDMRFAKALEYIAGSKLFFVVVDSDQTSKILIEAQSFAQRETCIPNNKISFRETPISVFNKENIRKIIGCTKN